MTQDKGPEFKPQYHKKKKKRKKEKKASSLVCIPDTLNPLLIKLPTPSLHLMTTVPPFYLKHLDQFTSPYCM
jgi:hypothetical protein